LLHRRAGRRSGAPSDDALARQDRDRGEEYRWLMRKFWFAAAIAIPVVLLSYPDFIGLDGAAATHGRACSA
jgi:hypothetical protein